MRVLCGKTQTLQDTVPPLMRTGPLEATLAMVISSVNAPLPGTPITFS